MKREEQLKQEGWVKQSTLEEPRLTEAVETYREIGFEVHLEPYDPSEESGCTECLAAAADRYKTIYTRKKIV